MILNQRHVVQVVLASDQQNDEAVQATLCKDPIEPYQEGNKYTS
jgi:hypothetical protein